MTAFLWITLLGLVALIVVPRSRTKRWIYGRYQQWKHQQHHSNSCNKKRRNKKQHASPSSKSTPASSSKVSGSSNRVLPQTATRLINSTKKVGNASHAVTQNATSADPDVLPRKSLPQPQSLAISPSLSLLVSIPTTVPQSQSTTQPTREDTVKDHLDVTRGSTVRCTVCEEIASALVISAEKIGDFSDFSFDADTMNRVTRVLERRISERESTMSPHAIMSAARGVVFDLEDFGYGHSAVIADDVSLLCGSIGNPSIDQRHHRHNRESSDGVVDSRCSGSASSSSTDSGHVGRDSHQRHSPDTLAIVDLRCDFRSTADPQNCAESGIATDITNPVDCAEFATEKRYSKHDVNASGAASPSSSPLSLSSPSLSNEDSRRSASEIIECEASAWIVDRSKWTTRLVSVALADVLCRLAGSPSPSGLTSSRLPQSLTSSSSSLSSSSSPPLQPPSPLSSTLRYLPKKPSLLHNDDSTRRAWTPLTLAVGCNPVKPDIAAVIARIRRQVKSEADPAILDDHVKDRESGDAERAKRRAMMPDAVGALALTLLIPASMGENLVLTLRDGSNSKRLPKQRRFVHSSYDVQCDSLGGVEVVVEKENATTEDLLDEGSSGINTSASDDGIEWVYANADDARNDSDNDSDDDGTGAIISASAGDDNDGTSGTKKCDDTETREERTKIEPPGSQPIRPEPVLPKQKRVTDIVPIASPRSAQEWVSESLRFIRFFTASIGTETLAEDNTPPVESTRSDLTRLKPAATLAGEATDQDGEWILCGRGDTVVGHARTSVSAPHSPVNIANANINTVAAIKINSSSISSISDRGLRNTDMDDASEFSFAVIASSPADDENASDRVKRASAGVADASAGLEKTSPVMEMGTTPMAPATTTKTHTPL